MFFTKDSDFDWKYHVKKRAVSVIDLLIEIGWLRPDKLNDIGTKEKFHFFKKSLQ